MDLKVVLVRVMSPIDASLTWILAGWLAGIIRASEEEQECKSATQSHRALKHIRIYSVHPLYVFLVWYIGRCPFQFDIGLSKFSVRAEIDSLRP